MCKLLKREPFDDVSYYQWLLHIIKADEYPYDEYVLLTDALHHMEYRWNVQNDKNRASDGIRLREIFVDEERYDVEEIPDRPCTVLEMMIGFARRIELDIMGEPGNDHPEVWFWIMVKNLGLDVCTDEAWNSDYFRQQVVGWMEKNPKIWPKYALFSSPIFQKKSGILGQFFEEWKLMNFYLAEK